MGTAGGAAAEPTSREGEGRQGSEVVGRNSLDVFSPAREDSRTPGTSAETPFGRTHVTSLEMLSRQGEGQQVVGRASLDIFSPVREGAGSHRKTPLVASAARCYSPLSIFQTPPPIKEEEPVTAAAAESYQQLQSGGGGPDHAHFFPADQSQPAGPTLLHPEPSLRRANGVQAQLSYDSPVPGAPPTAAAGAALSASVSSSLSHNIAEVVGQGGAAPLTSLQIHFIQNMIHETLEDFRDTCHRDIVNLQVEMVRQFYIQLNEIHGLIGRYSVNESLVEEIEKLREENRRLRTNY
ncbi:hypothetical protein INR49_009410 [Caranx melampygus]|nr:hypothetical protein INR49_009410 [Caranx melampygus]